MAAQSPDVALANFLQAATAPERPVHLWNPPFCGDIDMRIAANGVWYYGGSPIGRAALVKLFASILRKDPEGYVLVTPVEKVGVKVEDAPFLAVEMFATNGALRFRTNVDDYVEVGPDHPLRFEEGAAEGIKPYVRVRADLWALVTRPLFYDLVEMGAVEGKWFGVRAGGVFFPMRRAAEIEGL